MILIIGGYAQGKRAYAQKQFALGAEQILDMDILEGEILQKSSSSQASSLSQESSLFQESRALQAGYLAADHFNEWAAQCFREERDAMLPVREADRSLQGRLILLSREVGNGIVPMDPEDRAFREWMGRLQGQLAREASLVIRICCGLPRILKQEVTCYLIRHGATPGNRERRYIGRTEEALSAEGIAEVRSRGAYLSSREICFSQPEGIFVSPMKRCRQTAALLWPGREELQEIEALREMDFGAFEGMNYRELNGNTDYQAWIDGRGTGAFPGGESREAFIRRVMEGAREMGSRCRRQGLTTAAAVVHGGTIMALMSSLTGGSYFDFQVENCMGYRLKLAVESGGELILLEYEALR